MKIVLILISYVIAFAQDKSNAESSYIEGYELFMNGKVDSSIYFFSKSIAFSVENENDTILIKSYQALSDIYSRKGSFRKSDSLLAKSSLILAKQKDRHVHLNVKQQQLKIVKLLYQTKLNDAIQEISVSNKFIKKSYGNENNRSYLINQIYLGNIYGQKGEYKKSSSCFELALKIAKKILKADDTLFPAIYNNLGVLYKYSGDPYKALDFYLKALVDIKKYGIKNISEGMFYNNIGIIYSEFEDYGNAEQMFKKSVSEFKKLGEENPDIIRSYAALGELYYHRKQYDTAYVYLQTAKRMGHKLFKKEFKDRDDTILRIAINFEEWSKLDSAEHYFKEFAIIKRKAFGDDNPSYLLSLIHLGKFYIRVGNYARAEECIKKIDLNNSAEPMYEHKIMFAELYGDIQKNKFQETNLSQHWNNSFRSYNNALIEVKNFYFQQNVTEESKYIHSDFISEIYSKIITLLLDDNCPLSSDQTKQLISKFIESSKSNIFVNNLEKLRILSEKMGFEKFKSYQNLKTKIDSLELENTLNQSNKNQSTLFSLKEDFIELSNQLKENTLFVDKGNLYDQVNEDETILSYYQLADKLIIQVINSDGLDYISAPYSVDLNKLINDYLVSINKRQKKRFKELSQQLYEILIKRIESKISNRSKLIIIPHKLLYYLPFESLLKDNNYLIEKYELIYSYSYRFYLLKREKNVGKEAFLAFAPVFDSSTSKGKIKKEEVPSFRFNNLRSNNLFNKKNELNELPESENEVREISKLFLLKNKASELYLRDKSTKDFFLNEHSKYKYIHLATHGFINEKKQSLSGLFFHKSKDQTGSILYASESYNLELNADLIVLSSCESGLGRQINGEGILSLSKGFIYSGAHNVIQSLWKVFDKHTKELMVEFYKQHLNGNSFSKSLQKAKLKLISNPVSSFPKNWAGFVLIGSQSLSK
jgi:CHAT domain-containing protein/tetratricopeptide (TPR) repeat protein